MLQTSFCIRLYAEQQTKPNSRGEHSKYIRVQCHFTASVLSRIHMYSSDPPDTWPSRFQRLLFTSASVILVPLHRFRPPSPGHPISSVPLYPLPSRKSIIASLRRHRRLLIAKFYAWRLERYMPLRAKYIIEYSNNMHDESLLLHFVGYTAPPVAIANCRPTSERRITRKDPQASPRSASKSCRQISVASIRGPSPDRSTYQQFTSVYLHGGPTRAALATG